MKKRTRRLHTIALALVFLIGTGMVLWPILSEVVSYREDDAEYEDIAERYRLPDSSPTPGQISEEASVTTMEAVAEELRVTLLPDIETVEDVTVQPISEPTMVPVLTQEPNETVTPEETAGSLLLLNDEPVNTRVPERTSCPERTSPSHPEASASTAATAATQAPSSGIDLEACLAQNSDFVAWLTIPGTKIDYPVVRSDRTGYYLHHLFSGKESKLGCLFSLTSSDYRTPSRNIAIYGHHLSQSNAMFTTLLRYKDASYCASHSQVHLETLYGVRDYSVFAVVSMNINDWDTATASFSSDTAFMAFVNRARQEALYETGVSVTAEDHILTLITCDRSYGGADGRLIVMAVQE